MEQQVITEIDELFQELIVNKIAKSIEEVNASLDSLLGEESEIQYTLKQIPQKGGVRNIISEQLKDLYDQAESVSDKLSAEQKKIASMEAHVRVWLSQLATNTKTQIDDNEAHLKEYSETILLDSIKENVLNTEKSIVSSIENGQSNVVSEIANGTEAVEAHLEALFICEQSEKSFRKYFDSNIQMLYDKTASCQELLTQINVSIEGISINLSGINSLTGEIRTALSCLAEKSESFSKKSDFDKLQKSIDENTKRIDAISNTDVIEKLQMYKEGVDAKIDYLKKVGIFLILINMVTLITAIVLFLYK